MKNLTFKDYIILVLLVGCVIFGYMTFFRGDKYYREQLKTLKIEYKKEQDLRKSLDTELFKLKKDREDLFNRNKQLEELISLQDAIIEDRKSEAVRSRKELEETRKRIEEVRKKITYIKKNPANRTCDSLINSLKLKTGK